ncbi:4-(cytidine 5'-diphospho)-2-C-methyl-D-erythritol kinase [candidate division WOR-1 bacterium RIFCSPLOWO2_02_FULL_46_20]|uniref:4-diphosphocytidyl-2-C-methyl-D-erythritol kinase n=1 Tax=candidate division WOR-1 bacterium RIFCSPLOWO2_02_FULL_46_20 TaxID=1802567 RepID=A0A1F4REE4_UNCSA|nr:MAG: 4-(cytidine 5'-diphospho)-2-C-methyl-D-erythritol kinase [candidate division WOR-1 bacterium RIFCSPHIGHO2_02_FULL_45_12]OGC05853.1 MAG: 4-(cytidine 5'-diphospho)-2-C-methyl-D-erythritol kinase [candidate division WOR-1 bacterium RIFCSPLOWO2_02_FULL_46_20]
MRLKAHAKINFSLRVFEPRSDGFHAIESVMQSISLCDYITLTPIASGIEVTCSDPYIPLGRENLVYRAAELLGGGVKIHIEKHIPMAAGLAGGSADAAAVLYGLNAECRMPNTELMKIGAQIGSDVPFCLTGGTCLVTGRGEVVEKQEPWPKSYFVLVCPDVRVATKWAYEEFDRMHLEVSPAIKNDLEPVVVSRHEVITEIKDKLVSLGCSEAQMSGSGPSVFGVVRHKYDAENIYDKIKENYSKLFLVETVDKGVEIINEG